MLAVSDLRKVVCAFVTVSAHLSEALMDYVHSLPCVINTSIVLLASSVHHGLIVCKEIRANVDQSL